MRLRKRSTARSRGAALVSESRRDRRALARDAGLGRVSVVSLLGGVAAAVTAFAVLIGAAAAATSAAGFDTDLMSQEWRNLDASDAAILSAALFLACLFGGYVAGRMARRAGASHGFYTFALGAVLLVGAVAGLDQMTRSDALPTAFRTLGIPTAFDEWRDLPALVGLAWALTALVAACLGGAWGERWHTRLVERAADPNVGRGAAARVAAGDRLRGDTGMVDLSERLGTPPASEAEPVAGAPEQEPVRTP
jgi:hypothetical protein